MQRKVQKDDATEKTFLAALSVLTLMAASADLDDTKKASEIRKPF